MRYKLLGIACVAAGTALGQTTTTTTTTTSSGTITEYSPGTAFTVKEAEGPVSYSYGPNVVYSRGGKTLTTEEVKTIKVGTPVHIHYSTEGKKRLLDRVEFDDD